MVARGRRPGQPTSSNLLKTARLETSVRQDSSRRVWAAQAGIEFQGVGTRPAGRRRSRRVGLQGWLQILPSIGTSSPVGERTTSPRETGYPPIAGHGEHHDSCFSTLHDVPRLPPLRPGFGRSRTLDPSPTGSVPVA